ncbi:hypothetical protein AVEN_195346-1 [Araneus ventricosus]|uniref:Uncharacterized protein n=1 Tax=Araneus ventricosus TaxID=182803 RepID=A0A4Y2DHF6_ARAVE|nr:hypothetical protein AVEN_195346-1 [Araneus ventricosus]
MYNSSSSESGNMPSPQPIRRRRNSQDARMYRQLSSDSLDNLLGSPDTNQDRKSNARRHSVACGVLYVDMQKPSFKSAFNSAVKRMSSACSILSSAPSSTYNLSPHQSSAPPKKKEEEVLLPQVLGTFHQNRLPVVQNSGGADKRTAKNAFQVNRRFSTDCPPPSYSEATNLWKQPASRQKLTRQQQVVVSKESLMAVEDDDFGNLVE